MTSEPHSERGSGVPRNPVEFERILRKNDDEIYYGVQVISSSILSSVRQSAVGLSMGSLWQHVGVDIQSLCSSLSQRDVFFDVLRVLLDEGAVSLARGGAFLEGTSEEQINKMRKAWPNDPSPGDLDGIGLWFLVEAPAGLVSHVDGIDVWT